jgi:hypothetical protein
MKRLALFVLLFAGAFSSVGCSGPGKGELFWTPAYTAQEREDLIARNWDYEGKQAIDDWDSFWLLRPAGHLTIWNVR